MLSGDKIIEGIIFNLFVNHFHRKMVKFIMAKLGVYIILNYAILKFCCQHGSGHFAMPLATDNLSFFTDCVRLLGLL